MSVTWEHSDEDSSGICENLHKDTNWDAIWQILSTRRLQRSAAIKIVKDVPKNLLPRRRKTCTRLGCLPDSRLGHKHCFYTRVSTLQPEVRGCRKRLLVAANSVLHLCISSLHLGQKQYESIRHLPWYDPKSGVFTTEFDCSGANPNGSDLGTKAGTDLWKLFPRHSGILLPLQRTSQFTSKLNEH